MANNPWDIIEEYQTRNEGDPTRAWQQIYSHRDEGRHQHDPQSMADAEHWLWTQHNASKGIIPALFGMGGPAIHHAYKKVRPLLGVPSASEATPQQFMMGQTGAWAGLRKQLEQANLLKRPKYR